MTEDKEPVNEGEQDVLQFYRKERDWNQVASPDNQGIQENEGRDYRQQERRGWWRTTGAEE